MTDMDRKVRRATGYADIVRAKPRRKKSPGALRKTAVHAADRWASLDIRLDGKCVSCGSTANIQCGHLFSRIAYSTRWKEENLYCVCAKCNIAQENDPKVARRLLQYAETVWGEMAIEDLHRLYESARPVKTWEIQEYAIIWEGKYRKHLDWRSRNR